MKEFDFGRLMGAMQMLAQVRQMLLMKDVVATAGTGLLPKNPVILAMDSIFSRDMVRRARETEARGREVLRRHNSTLKETVATSLPREAISWVGTGIWQALWVRAIPARCS